MGKVLEKSLSILPTLKSTGETLDDLNARAKDAARNAGEGLSRLATPSSVAEGRIKCPVSANGASDCKVAADKLCQAKGLKEGKSLSTDSVEACSAKVLIPGRTRKPDDCRTDNFVTRAFAGSADVLFQKRDSLVENVRQSRIPSCAVPVIRHGSRISGYAGR